MLACCNCVEYISSSTPFTWLYFLELFIGLVLWKDKNLFGELNYHVVTKHFYSDTKLVKCHPLPTGYAFILQYAVELLQQLFNILTILTFLTRL